MRTIKVEVADEVWEQFFRYFPGQGERSRILRNFIHKRIREEHKRKLEEEHTKGGYK